MVSTEGVINNKQSLISKLGITTAIVGGMLGAGILFGVLPSAFLGVGQVRGEKEVYSFKYQNQSARIMQQDIKFAPDRYYLKLPNGIMAGGEIIDDNGQHISLNQWGYSIK